MTTPIAQGARSAQTYSAAQRIAVVITILGEAAARPILEKMDDETLARVSAAIETVPSLPLDAIRDIIRSFSERAQSASTALSVKRDEARKLVDGLVAARRGTGGPGEATMGTSAGGVDIWARLEKRPADKLGVYLSGLSPNLISLVLRRLSPNYAAEVICHVDETKLRPMLGFMVQAQASDAGIEGIVTRMIELEFLNANEDTTSEDHQHLGMLGEMLSLVPTEKRDSMVEFLRSHHEGKLASIQKSLLTIDALPDMLPRNAVPAIFRELDAQLALKLIKSLEASYPKVAEFLLANISSRLATQMREDVAGLDRVSEAEAEAVQRDTLALLMKMKRSGAIAPATD